MKVVMVEPGQYARIMELENTLQAEQEAVGGRITCAYPWKDPVCIVANDEGLLNGMPLNRYVERYQAIAGPFFICGLTEDNFGSLTDEQAEQYRKMFFQPEVFFKDRYGSARIRYDDPKLPNAPKEVAERYEQRGGFPDLCFAASSSTGDLFMLRYGENGYGLILSGLSYKKGQAYADKLNEQMGVSKAQQQAMLYACIHGWTAPLPPSHFEENSDPKTSPGKSKEREER